MDYLRRLNPLRALGDLRRFLAQRGKHEIIFLFASFAICYALLATFVWGTTVEKPWVRPDIIYVQSWRADRSEAEILAQQKIDLAQKQKDDAEQARFAAEKRAGYKKLKDKLSPWL
ncbi:MAG: hypothetical protein J0I47_11325 [Sphingomonas sp.]|uniref:hypothetical protein n=1 Tax=Sphingomonas sp. TaxID=28214 RepID=UPI001AD522C9|nr:hypothetical protein [Sphingomonas sp.]MBN8808804.1 hypothetical protein [Sphingomonas sp.]